MQNKEELKSNLKSLYLKGSLSHAILINSESDDEALSVSKYLASLLLEKNDLQSPDLTILENTDGKQYNIENIRALRDNAFTAPLVSKYKVFIVSSLQTMSFLSQNALLKVIEEPPENVVFIFTAKELKNILPTIISRVTIFNLSSDNVLEETARAKEAINYIINKNEFSLINALAASKQREDLDKFFSEIYSCALLYSKQDTLRYKKIIDIITEAKIKLKKNVNMSALIVVISHKLIKG